MNIILIIGATNSHDLIDEDVEDLQNTIFSTNIRSKREVKDVRKLSDGTLALDADCQDDANQKTTKAAPNKPVKYDDVKKTTAKPQQKVTNKPSEFYLKTVMNFSLTSICSKRCQQQ